ncbi:MAG: hypothetical protein IPN86_10920 [Saprospiraceae bacterium]|nr:hypothetical protein [Saprospiraceae bacterium]
MYVYDAAAQMSYYSIDLAGSTNDEFWSYNDQTSVEDKVDYVWDNILGGSMIWELHSGYIATNPAGSRIPQLSYLYDQNCLRDDPCPDPFPICAGETYTLTANGASSGIQWYKDGTPIPAPTGTALVLIASEAGVYTWRATDNNGCEINNCCSITLEPCCAISQTHTTPVCNNNNTNGNAADDYITFNITGIVNNGSGNYVVKIGAWTSASTPSGTPISIIGNGQGSNPTLTANGTTSFTIRLEDAFTSTCFTEFVINPVAACPCSVLLTANPSTCTPATNTYSVDGNVTFSNVPSTGTLTVSVGAVVQTFNPPFSSPQTYTLTGLTAAGGTQTVMAVFTGDATCMGTQTYAAPVSCAPVCAVSQTHTTPVCNHNNTGGISTDDYISFSVTGTVTNGSGNYVVKIGVWTSPAIASGQSVSIVGNGLSGNPLIPANGTSIGVRIEDANASTCFTSFNISSASCSNCPTLNCGTVTVQKN